MTLLRLAAEREEEGIVSQTRKGHPIQNQKGRKLLPHAVENQRGLLRQGFSSIIPYQERKPPTNLYNCHGLTFLSRRARLTDEKEIRKVLDDDEYENIDIAKTMPGDIVIYYDGDAEITHTGVVVRVAEGVIPMPYILSKWGDAGEYEHRYNNCPYWKQGFVVRFMREGRND